MMGSYLAERRKNDGTTDLTLEKHVTLQLCTFGAFVGFDKFHVDMPLE